MLVEDLTLQTLCYVLPVTSRQTGYIFLKYIGERKTGRRAKLGGGFQFMILISHQFIVFKNL